MATQWGDPGYADRQIQISQNSTNQQNAIISDGWKNSLADDLSKMGLEMIKQSYIDERLAKQQARDEGVLDEANIREDRLTEEKRASEQPKTDALIEESKAKTAKYKAEAADIGKTKASDTGKMSDLDKKDFDYFSKVSNDQLAPSAQRNEALDKLDEIRAKYNISTPTPSKGSETVAQLRARKAASQGGGVLEKEGPVDKRSSYQKSYDDKTVKARGRVAEIEELLKSKYTPENTKVPLQKELDELVRKYKL